SPQPGHQRTSWSLTKSLRVSSRTWRFCGDSAGTETLPSPLEWPLVGCSFISLLLAQQLFRCLLDLDDAERLATDAVEATDVDQELGAEEHRQLAEVDLGHEHVLVTAQNRLCVLGKRVHVPHMGVSHAPTLCLKPFDGTSDSAVRRAPAEDEEVAVLR